MLSISQIKEYCKFLNIKGYTKCKTKSKLILFIKNLNVELFYLLLLY